MLGSASGYGTYENFPYLNAENFQILNVRPYMRTGYSILLGEFIEAGAITHRDCEPFQIVCPACHEPLFKVERPSNTTATEYLSHYRQSESFDSNCELRSSSTTAAERNRHNAESQNQKLSYFLSVFTSMLEKDQFISYGLGFHKTHKQLNRSKAWRFFRRKHLESARTGGFGDKGQFSSFADFYIKEGFEKRGLGGQVSHRNIRSSQG